MISWKSARSPFRGSSNDLGFTWIYCYCTTAKQKMGQISLLQNPHPENDEQWSWETFRTIIWQHDVSFSDIQRSSFRIQKILRVSCYHDLVYHATIDEKEKSYIPTHSLDKAASQRTADTSRISRKTSKVSQNSWELGSTGWCEISPAVVVDLLRWWQSLKTSNMS